jgi:isoleucyl-tRNA synthetase
VELANSNAATAGGQVDEIEVVHADGKKCERCWNYSIHVGENADYPTICERCTPAIAEIESSRDAAVESANR